IARQVHALLDARQQTLTTCFPRFCVAAYATVAIAELELERDDRAPPARRFDRQRGGPSRPRLEVPRRAPAGDEIAPVALVHVQPRFYLGTNADEVAACARADGHVQGTE